MIGIKLEMLSLMTTMHAVGLMPDDVYQQEKERLVGDIIAIGSETIPLDLESWKRGWTVDGYVDFSRSPIPQFRDARTFDWRSVILNLLESAHKNGWDNQDEIEEEAEIWGVQAEYLDDLSGSAHSLAEVNMIRKLLRDFEVEIGELRSEVKRLKKVSSERSEYAPSYNHTEIAEPRRNANLQQIDELQTQMARLLSYAAQYDAKGNTFAAGQHRAEAAKLESKLRALGA